MRLALLVVATAAFIMCHSVSARAQSAALPAPAATGTAPDAMSTPIVEILPALQPSAAPVPTAMPTPRTLAPVIVTAQRHPTSIYGTSKQTYIVSSGDLERLGAKTAAEALRFVPATVVQQYGTYGSLGTVALRGASSSQTLVLINGQPANESDTGAFDLSSLPANLIDHIEVVQGGSSTLYGSAAMGGVVNIITKQPISAGNVNLYAEVGYQGTLTYGLGFTAGGPDLLARFDFQGLSASSNFAYPGYSNLYPGGVRTNSDAKNSDAGISVDAHLGVVNAVASFQNDTSAIGTPGSVGAPYVSLFAQQQRVYQRLNFDFDLPLKTGDVEFQVASNGRRLHFFDDSQYYQNGSPAFQFDNQANGDTRSASLRATLGLGPSNVVTAGLDSTGADVTFYQTYVPPNSPQPKPCQGFASFASCTAQDATTAWYVQDELHAPSSPLTLSAGVRDQRAQGTQPTAVPSFGMLYRLSNSVDALANYGRAFRTPNLDERYYPGYGSASLQPEYGATFDLGIRCHGSRAECTLSYFGQDTSNLIVNLPVDAFGDVQPFNVSRASVRGVQTSVEQRVGNFAHTYLAYTNFIRAADLSPGNSGAIRLLYRPTSTAALSIWIGRGTWSYGLDSTYVGRRYGDEANTLVLSPYVVSGVYVRKTVSRHLALTVRAQNLGNNHNAEDVFGYPIVGSALSVRLSSR